MRTLQARNVNHLYVDGMEMLADDSSAEASRAGAVVVMPCPVMSVYEIPCERVLFNEARDANPFFHLMEGLWMLAGRDDAAFLTHYIKDFGERFAEEHGYIHGAYGYRWRAGLGFDQLDAVVEKLQKNPQDRQCVIQMWDATDKVDGGGHGWNDLTGEFRDRPCNTHLYLRVRKQFVLSTRAYDYVLDMTICCRSNDIVWGAYGANAVHFSMLLEYLAGRIGVGVGTMYQLSNNYHGYINVLDRLDDNGRMELSDPYENGEVHSVPMGDDWESWDIDLHSFMSWHNAQWITPIDAAPNFSNSWFLTTAVNVAEANRLWKRGRLDTAMEHAKQIGAPDWRRACIEWFNRRTPR